MTEVSAEALKGHLDLLLLAALREGPDHGYRVLARLSEMTDGTFDLPEGTIYPALHRLERRGLLTSRWQKVNGRRRRVYEMTANGQQEFVVRRTAWERFARGVARALEPTG